MKFSMNRFLSVALLLMFVSGSALGQPHANTDGNNASQPEALDSKSDFKPAAVAGDDAKAGSEHKEEQCRYKGPGWFTEFYCFFALHDKFWVSFGTLVLAAFTVLLGIATAILAYATKRLVNGAEDTAKRQLRAYVLLESAKIEHVAAGEKPRATVKIKNFGQTPAYELTHWAAMEYATFPRTEDPDMSDPEGMPIAHIGRGGRLTKEVPLDYDSELSGEQFEAINSGRAALYLIGRAAYVDAFGEVQSTEYIVFVGGPLGLGPYMGGYHTGHKAS